MVAYAVRALATGKRTPVDTFPSSSGRQAVRAQRTVRSFPIAARTDGSTR